MQKICFVVPYFGQFPFWVDYFFASCKANPSIDFLLYTDNTEPPTLPSNVFYRYMDFEGYKRKVSATLGINFNPSQAYKLCDIKPAYGLIHRDDLKGYDFWGFCDLDLVFGSIRNFFTENLLARYDVISTHDRRVSGHCCLLRNNSKYVNAFKKVASWKKIFEDSQHHGFDEKDFSRLFVGYKNYPKTLKNTLQYIFLPYSRSAYFVEHYSTPGLRYNWLDGSRNFPTEWYWSDGRLTNNAATQEFLYFHFLEWKRGWGEMSKFFEVPPSREWLISSVGFQSFFSENKLT